MNIKQIIINFNIEIYILSFLEIFLSIKKEISVIYLLLLNYFQ